VGERATKLVPPARAHALAHFFSRTLSPRAGCLVNEAGASLTRRGCEAVIACDHSASLMSCEAVIACDRLVNEARAKINEAADTLMQVLR